MIAQGLLIRNKKIFHIWGSNAVVSSLTFVVILLRLFFSFPLFLCCIDFVDVANPFTLLLLLLLLLLVRSLLSLLLFLTNQIVVIVNCVGAMWRSWGTFIGVYGLPPFFVYHSDFSGYFFPVTFFFHHPLSSPNPKKATWKSPQSPDEKQNSQANSFTEDCVSCSSRYLQHPVCYTQCTHIDNVHWRCRCSLVFVLRRGDRLLL